MPRRLSKTVHTVAIAHGCPSELDGRSKLLKTAWTFIRGHGDPDGTDQQYPPHAPTPPPPWLSEDQKVLCRLQGMGVGQGRGTQLRTPGTTIRPGMALYVGVTGARTFREQPTTFRLYFIGNTQEETHA